MHAGPVLIIGSGLLGASLGLRLRLRDITVYLEDSSPLATALARDLGAGRSPRKAPGSRASWWLRCPRMSRRRW